MEEKENTNGSSSTALFNQFRLKKENIKLKPTNFAIENKFLQRKGNANFRVGVSCMQGKRETMEDAHSIVLDMDNHPGWGFFGIFDGHEGGDTANFCAEKLWKKLDECEEFSEELIKEKFLEFDDMLGERQSGSTACILLVDSKKSEEGHPVIVGNLGDSRAFIGHYDSSEFKCLTRDHKPSLPEEAERIEAAGAQVFRNRVNSSLAVSRAFGDSQYKDNKNIPKDKQKVISVPDVSRVYLQSDQFLFICCDGIFEALSNESTLEFLQTRLKESQDISHILSELITTVLKGGSRDNMSAMIIQVSDGTDYNREDEFLVGTWYTMGNASYKNGYRLDCENHGLKWEDVEMNLIKSSEGDGSGLGLCTRSLPSLVSDKTTLALKSSSRPGISKSSRVLVVSPTTLSKAELEKKEPKKIQPEKGLSASNTNHDNHEKQEKEKPVEKPVEKPAEKPKPSGFLFSKSKSQKPMASKNGKKTTVVLTKSSRDKKK